jgi:hypothetical protein
MKVYKILFEENVPVSAHCVAYDQRQGLKIDVENDKRRIKWITVYADNEEDGMSVANKVIEEMAAVL